jgi:predicted metal-dependent peptidase
LEEVTKRIGSEHGFLDSVFALIAKLRRDPFTVMQAHRSAFRGLFGLPTQRSMNPRADEVYLRKHGLIKYLPRFTRRPVVRELTVIVDTSGSMSDEEIGKALGVLKQLAGSHYLFNLLVCDTQPILIGRRMRSIPDSVECPRGGTALGEGVRQAKELGLSVENVVYITDGYNTDWADDVDEVRKVCVILTVPKRDGDAPESYIEEFRKRVLAQRSSAPDIHVIYMEDVLDAVSA